LQNYEQNVLVSFITIFFFTAESWEKIIVNFALTLKVRRKNFNIISTFGYYIKLKIHSGAPLVFTDQTTGTFIRFLLPHLLGSVIEKL
jgi:hypothetical protein